jgi:ATP-binding cassette subfamily C protein
LDQLKTIFRITAFFLKHDKSKVISCLLLSALSSLLDGIGILAIIPIVGLLYEASQSDAGRAARYVRELANALGTEGALAFLLAVIVVCIAGKSLLGWLSNRSLQTAAVQIQTDFRTRLITALCRARWPYFVELSVGRISNAINSEPPRAASAFGYIVMLYVMVIQSAVYLGTAFAVSPAVSMAAIALGILMIVAFRRVSLAARQAGEAETGHLNQLVKSFADVFHGIKAIKAMAQEEEMAALLRFHIEGLRRALVRQALASQVIRLVQEPVATLFLAIGLYVALTALKMPLSEIVVLAILFWRTIGSISGYTKIVQSILISESGLKSMREAVETAEHAQETRHLGKPAVLAHSISFSGVDFSYGSKNVLNAASFKIPANGVTAVVGPSGAGKTTIADLILGLQLPDRGSIYIDDVPLAEIDFHVWRRSVGYVPQEPAMFNATIFENVAMANPSVTREQARRALFDAGASAFVDCLELGIDQPIGERGLMLSGGQRQRIALARALVRNTKLLILDEATSALDAETEKTICETIKELSQRIPVLLISHQPMVINISDRVLRIQNGTVVSSTTQCART